MESPKPQSSDEAQSDLLAHAASSSAGQGQPPAGHLEESERVWAAVRSLKGERRCGRGPPAVTVSCTAMRLPCC